MAQPAHTLQPEQYGNIHSPRPTQRGIPTFHVHRGRAERIRRIYEAEELAPGEKRASLLAIVAVDGALCAHARGKGRAWPYVATLAQETHQSERTVQRATAWLVAQGFLATRRTGRYNVYFPLFLVAQGTGQIRHGGGSKERGLSVPSGDKQTDPRSTAAPAVEPRTADPEQQPPSGDGVVAPNEADLVSSAPDPRWAQPENPNQPAEALQRAVALTTSPGLAAALRRGMSVRIERGVCVLTPRHQWQIDLLRPLLRPSDDPRHIELVQAVEIAFGGGTRLRLATPR